MRSVKKYVICGSMAAVLFLFFTPFSVWADFLYKKYQVKYDRGRDVLCEPYVVQKNDWILKLFQKKGEIAYRDFSDFLNIFRRVNPHIKNVNRIRPGQYILIPLRKIELESLPGQSTGTVTIPFVTLSKPTETIKARTGNYTVEKGDCVSVLVARTFGKYGTIGYRRGIDLFRQMNPSVTDLDRIYIGQKLFLPSAEAEKIAFNRPGPDVIEPASAAPSKTSPHLLASPLEKIAWALDAKLMDRGFYYFPKSGTSDVKLDLSVAPVMIMKSGTRILFRKKSVLKAPDLAPVKAFWKDLKVVDIRIRATVDDIFQSVMDALQLGAVPDSLQFSDQGVSVTVSAQWVIEDTETGDDSAFRRCVFFVDTIEERTSPAIVRYLEQHNILIREIVRGRNVNARPHLLYSPAFKIKPAVFHPGDVKNFVKTLTSVLGYAYSSDVAITFPYAGVQVTAASNLISTLDGIPVFVDFGDLFGEAVSAIRKSGFRIVQIRKGEKDKEAVLRLIAAIGSRVEENPKLLAADRPAALNTTVGLPGILFENPGNNRLFWTHQPLPAEIVYFLWERDIRVVQMERTAN